MEKFRAKQNWNKQERIEMMPALNIRCAILTALKQNH
jgi:hypothetical protein